MGPSQPLGQLLTPKRSTLGATLLLVLGVLLALGAAAYGLLGWGIWTPKIDAADTLDRIGG